MVVKYVTCLVSFSLLSGELGAEGEGRAVWSLRPKAHRRRGPKFSGRGPASASSTTEAPSGCLLCEAGLGGVTLCPSQERGARWPCSMSVFSVSAEVEASVSVGERVSSVPSGRGSGRGTPDGQRPRPDTLPFQAEAQLSSCLWPVPHMFPFGFIEIAACNTCEGV